MTETPITVVVVDDHDIVRRGLIDLLEASGELEVVGQAGTVAEAKTVLGRTRPSLAVLDVRLPDGTGLDVARFVADEAPDTRVVMLTSFSDDQAMVDAAAAGAKAYLLKEVQGTAIVDSLLAVAGGATLLDKAMVRLAKGRLGRSEVAIPDSLSPQERRIFELIGDGMSNREIAGELFLAEKTVKNYTSNLLAKLGMQRRTEVAALAARVREHERRRFT